VTGFIVFAVGLLFCWLALAGWRTRADDRISLLEATILKTTGAEPLPLTRFDRWLHTFQLIMLTIFGPVITALGFVLILD
jgi:hypothetical protein